MSPETSALLVSLSHRLGISQAALVSAVLARAAHELSAAVSEIDEPTRPPSAIRRNRGASRPGIEHILDEVFALADAPW
jgi:hypothetical protein